MMIRILGRGFASAASSASASAAASAATSVASASGGAAAAAAQLPTILTTLLLKRDPLLLREPSRVQMEHAVLMEREAHMMSRAMSRNFHVPAATTLAEHERPRVERTPRETDADRAGDTRSLRRRLDEALYLVVRRGRARKYHLPEVELRHGAEDLRQSAERALREFGCAAMDPWIVGNAPVGVSAAAKGVKRFYMKGVVFRGSPQIPQEWDHAWLTADELGEHMDKEQFRGVKDLLCVPKID